MGITAQESLLLETHALDDDERAYWADVHRKLRAQCDPLARFLGHKNVTYPLSKSGGQLSKELSGTEDKDLSALTALFLARKTQDTELNRYLVCDVLGFKAPERQQPPSLAEENEKLRAELSRMRNALRLALSETALPIRAVKP